MRRLLGTFLVALAFTSGHAQEKKSPVFRTVTSERLESVLAELKIDFKKTADPKKSDVQFYDFTKNKLALRIHNYQGKDLWIDSMFTEKMTLDKVNQWNAGAKYSRAVLVQKDDKSSVSLESQLDCLGGVTEANIKSFITRFESEVGRFSKEIATNKR